MSLVNPRRRHKLIYFILVCCLLLFGWMIYCSVPLLFYSFVFLQMCSSVNLSEMWSEFFASTPGNLQPPASLVKSSVLASKADGIFCVPTLEVLKHGNIGLYAITSAIFQQICSRSQSTYSACISWSFNIVLLQLLKGHSQLMHMRISYHFVAGLARETDSDKRIRNI